MKFKILLVDGIFDLDLFIHFQDIYKKVAWCFYANIAKIPISGFLNWFSVCYLFSLCI